MRLLDLFAGAGGAAVGYHRAGFAVTGVDLEHQPNYPYAFVRRDAFDLLTDPRWATFVANFDAIHASPPCQPFTAYRRRGGGVGDRYLNLVAETRTHLRATGNPYIIEDVPGAPLQDPVLLCGSSFGLDLRRHRLFESNVPLVVPDCNHDWQTPRFPQATNRANLRRTVEVGAYRCAGHAAGAMGIDWMTNREVSQAVPPAYTTFLGRQLHAYLRAREEARAVA